MSDNQPNYHIDDAALVRQCQKGNADAMGLLITKYQDRLYNAILKICQNRDDAAELTQETFVKVLENIGSFRSQSGIYTWLFRIGMNLTINFCNRRFKVVSGSLDQPQDSHGRSLAGQVQDTRQPEPCQSAQNRETAQIVMAALERLDNDHRVILVLREIEQMSYEQIAETLDIELGTVKSRLSRARTALGEFLEAVRI